MSLSNKAPDDSGDRSKTSNHRSASPVTTTQVLANAAMIVMACGLIYAIVKHDAPWQYIFLPTIFPACSFLGSITQQAAQLDYADIVQLACLFMGAAIYLLVSANRNLLPPEWVGAATGVGSLFCGVGLGGLAASNRRRR